MTERDKVNHKSPLQSLQDKRLVLCLTWLWKSSEGCRGSGLASTRGCLVLFPPHHVPFWAIEAHWSIVPHMLLLCRASTHPEELCLTQTSDEMRILRHQPISKDFSRPYALWKKQGHLLRHPACFQAPTCASRQKWKCPFSKVTPVPQLHSKYSD